MKTTREHEAPGGSAEKAEPVRKHTPTFAKTPASIKKKRLLSLREANVGAPLHAAKGDDDLMSSDQSETKHG